MAEANRALAELVDIEEFWYGEVSADNRAAPEPVQAFHPDSEYESSGDSFAVVDGKLTVLKTGLYFCMATVQVATDTDNEVKAYLQGGFSNFVQPFTIRDFTGYAGNHWLLPSLSGVARITEEGTPPNVIVSNAGLPGGPTVDYLEYSIVRIG